MTDVPSPPSQPARSSAALRVVVVGAGHRRARRGLRRTPGAARRRGRRARGLRPGRRQAAARPRSAGSPSTWAPSRCSTGVPRASSSPARSGSARMVHPATTAARIWSPRPAAPDAALGDGRPRRPRRRSRDPGSCPRQGLARAAHGRRAAGDPARRRDVSVGWLIEQRLRPRGPRPAGRAAARRRVRRPRPRDLRAGRGAAGRRPARPGPVDDARGGRGRSAAASSATPVFAGLVGGVGRLPQARRRGARRAHRHDRP